jgi:cyclohexyl-isocyanide hydratase
LPAHQEIAMASPIRIGFVLFPNVTQLDFTGPLQVLSRVPGAEVHLIWKRIEPLTSDTVLTFLPTTTFADCPQLDVICVPGGAGADDAMLDEEILAFLRKQAAGARYITSVCTGALVLGSAGLLKGYRAATHWSARPFLSRFGATLDTSRVCVDRNRVTGGGVTAGIDFALTLVSLMFDRKTAEMIQLGIEYNPAPPFDAGSPESAPADVVSALTERAGGWKQREAKVARAAEKLGA